MKVFQAVGLLVGSTLFIAGIVAGQEPAADSVSCALWLQWAESAKSAKPGEVYVWPSAPEEVQQFAVRVAEAYSARGIRQGYAMGVFATTAIGPGSHLRNVGEFITAVDTLCAGAPQKRLVDVALHALGRR